MILAKEALATIQRGADEIIQEEALLERFQSGVPLRVKLGIDPTAADLHFGHTVVINKLRQFQELGHDVLFLVGDFTALIGDPWGRKVPQNPWWAKEIAVNPKPSTVKVLKILNEKKTKVMFNSEW